MSFSSSKFSVPKYRPATVHIEQFPIVDYLAVLFSSSDHCPLIMGCKWYNDDGGFERVAETVFRGKLARVEMFRESITVRDQEVFLLLIRWTDRGVKQWGGWRLLPVQFLPEFEEAFLRFARMSGLVNI